MLIFYILFSSFFSFLAQVIKLVLLEAANEGALVFLEGNLGHQVDDTEGINEAHNVYFFTESLASFLMSLVPLGSPLAPETLGAEAAAARLDEPGRQVFRVGVPILATLHHCVEHYLFRFILSLWSTIIWVASVTFVIIRIFPSLRRSGINRSNQ